MINSNFGRNLISNLDQQFSMSRLLLILCLLVQLSAVIEGAYEVFVTVDSFELLESRCSECTVYSSGSPVLEQGLCCDGTNVPGEDTMLSCPNTCDVKLIFCHLESFTEQPVSLGSRCLSYSETILGYNFTTSDGHEYHKTGLVGLLARNPLFNYTNTGKWVAGDMQLRLMVVDKDISVGPDDLIDQFVIPINISAGSSFSSNYSRNYSRIELTIEVKCLGDDVDENNCVSDGCDVDCNNGECIEISDHPVCICLNGIVGPNCDKIVECLDGICNSGNCTLPNVGNDYQCECLPGFSGMLCEHNIDDCIGVTCNNAGTCVDGVATFSCVCDPGYTGNLCDTEIVTTTALSTDGGVVDSSSFLPLAAIVGGAVGGVVCVLVLAIVIVLALLIFTRIRKTKTYDIQESTYDDAVFSNQVVSKGGQVPIYEEADVNRKGHKSDTGGSETLKQFNNPIYGDDDNVAELELEHEYETTDQARSKTVRNKHEQGQYSELERKFENPIYGDDSNGDEYEQDQYSKLDRKFEHPIKNDDNKGDEREPDQYSKLERKFEHPKSDDNNGDEREPDQYSKLERKFEHPVHGDDNKSDEHLQEQYSKLERKFEKPINGDNNNGEEGNMNSATLQQDNYDQIGNIYHTLESGKEREERYARTSLSGSAPETSGVKEWSGGPANKPKHSYEDMD